MKPPRITCTVATDDRLRQHILDFNRDDRYDAMVLIAPTDAIAQRCVLLASMLSKPVLTYREALPPLECIYEDIEAWYGR